MNFEVCLVLSLVVLVSASPTEPGFWKGTLDATVEKMRSSCSEDNSMACFQYKAFWFLRNILQGDYLELPGSVEVNHNGYRSDVSSRSSQTLESKVEETIKSYNVKLSVPSIGSITVDPRNLDNEEIDMKFDFSSGDVVEGRKKSKLKKIFVPILVFILLKAITLVPFALGVLGFKAWNSLQLAFFSFIISTGVAIFQLCQKLAADSAHPHIAAAGPWDVDSVNRVTGKSMNDMQMAYSSYVQP